MVKKSFKSVEVGPQVGPPWFFPVFPGGSALRGTPYTEATWNLAPMPQGTGAMKP